MNFSKDTENSPETVNSLRNRWYRDRNILTIIIVTLFHYQYIIMNPKNFIKIATVGTGLILINLAASMPARSADYLELSGQAKHSTPKATVQLSWNNHRDTTFIVKSKKSSEGIAKWKKVGEFDSPAMDIEGGPSNTIVLYTVSNLECDTKYDFKVKMKHRGWNDITVKTHGCGATACPSGGVFDGANCFIGKAPAGTSAFIYNGNYYYTSLPSNSCPLTNSHFDGANCFVQSISSSVKPFIHANGWYYGAYP
jgi:hypothetical protein